MPFRHSIFRGSTQKRPNNTFEREKKNERENEHNVFRSCNKYTTTQYYYNAKDKCDIDYVQNMDLFAESTDFR